MLIELKVKTELPVVLLLFRSFEWFKQGSDIIQSQQRAAKDSHDFHDGTTDLHDTNEAICDVDVDIKKLNDITIPKHKVVEKEVVPKKKVNFTIVFLLVFILVVAMFFFFNPEVIVGKDKNYVCDREYNHNVLYVFVKEEVKLTFSGKGKIKNSVVTNNYIFNSDSRYNKFKNNGEFYKYMNEGDTYKFIDEEKTYRVMSNIKDLREYFSSEDEDSILEYYNEKNYKCKKIEKE